MSKNSEEYFATVSNLYDNRKRQLLKREENAILKIYRDAFNQQYRELLRDRKFEDKTARQVAKAGYVKQLAEELMRQQEKASIKLSKEDAALIDSYLTKVYPQYKDSELSNEIAKNTNTTNKWLIDQLVQGKFYKDGVGLSDRLWNAVGFSGRKIDDAIASMIAQGKGAADISRTLREFSNGGHRTWSKNKLREKLGDGYARKYGTTGLDYEALRLARTTLQHQAQLAVMHADKINPYAGAVRWKSSHQANRTCSLCISRETDNPDGLGPGIYYSENCPLDHPNGLCHLTHVFVMNGKVVTPEEMADDIGKWIRGEPNSGTMDKLYKGIPKPSVKATPKPQPKPEPEPTPSLNNIAKGCRYTDVERAERFNKMPRQLMQAFKDGGASKAPLHANKITNILKTKYPDYLQDLYLSTLDDFLFKTESKGSFYRPSDKTIYGNLDKWAHAKDGEYATMFHEWGHMIDDKYKFFGKTASNNEDFKAILWRDYDNKLYETMKQGNLTEAQANKVISQQLKKAPDNQIAGVSDVYGGISEGKAEGYWAHKQAYWDRRDRRTEVASEAWADILDSYAAGPEGTDEYLPKSKSWVEERAKQINEREAKK